MFFFISNNAFCLKSDINIVTPAFFRCLHDIPFFSLLLLTVLHRAKCAFYKQYSLFIQSNNLSFT